MEKYKYLLLNTILFAFSSVLVKFLSFLLLPLYTGTLSPSEYGEVEVLNITITLILPILTLSIAEAVIRFTFIKDTNRKSILTNGLIITIAGIGILIACYPIFKLLDKTISDYFVYFILIYATQAIEQLLFKFVKGLEKVKICALDGIVAIIVTVVSNLILLLKFKMGLQGYLTAMILSQGASCIFLFLSGELRKYVDFTSINRKMLKEMLIYSIPFIPTAIAWWINSAADRYVILYMLGIEATGLYSVASKLPSIISIVTSIFNQSWQISSVKEYGNKDYEVFFARIYNLYNSVMVAVGSVLIVTTPLIAKFLFSGEFYIAWKLAPFLLVGALFSGLSGVIATVFLAVKKTKVLMVSTICGAVMNLLLNYILIGIIGAQGASIATAFSFAVVWIIRFLTSLKYIKIEINWFTAISSYTLLVSQATLMVNESLGSLIICVCITIIMLFLNMKQYLQLFHYARKFVYKF